VAEPPLTVLARDPRGRQRHPDAGRSRRARAGPRCWRGGRPLLPAGPLLLRAEGDHGHPPACGCGRDGASLVPASPVRLAAVLPTAASPAQQPTPGWGIANLSAGWRSARLAVTVRIANLFDRAYGEHLSFQRDPFRSGARLPEPGHSLFLNASVQLP
jgi:hypothetical protein